MGEGNEEGGEERGKPVSVEFDEGPRGKGRGEGSVEGGGSELVDRAQVIQGRGEIKMGGAPTRVSQRQRETEQEEEEEVGGHGRRDGEERERDGGHGIDTDRDKAQTLDALQTQEAK